MVRAVVFDGNLRMVDRAKPVPAADEVLIQLRTAGVCNTDLELMRGYRDFSGALGHEFVGTVIEGPEEWMGQRVVGDINVACQQCEMCRRGMPTHCLDRRVLGIFDYDGAFSDMFRLPIRNLHTVPANIPDDAAVFTEPLAAACQIVEEVHVRPSQRVVVVGAGKLGLLAAQVIMLTGADVVGVAHHERSVRLLKQWGVPVVAASKGLPPHEADVVIDCTGSASGFTDCMKLVRPRGTLVVKNTYHGLLQTDMTSVAVNEIKIVGSRCGSFEPALRLLAHQLVDVSSLVDAVFELGNAPQALERAAKRGTLKVLIKP